MRRPAARVKPRIAKLATYPAPVGGWIANQNLATPGARRPDGSKVNGAAMLENWFPISTGVRMRRGSAVFAQVDGEVRALFAYVNGNNTAFFASTDAAIYDITAGPKFSLYVDEDGNFLVNENGDFFYDVETRTPVVEGQSNGFWSVIQFATPGGVFLRAVNGVDTPQVYDGAAWSVLPAITGVDVGPSALSYVWVFKRRMFFIQKDSLNAYYLPADSIGGAAVKLPLGGVFTRGGSLLFGASWSLDGGGGLTAQCIFVTTEGEVAVYQGDDPSVAASWSLVGVYRIGKPRGPNGWFHAGGDVCIATDIGLVPLSQAVQRDYAALSPSAISYPIETEWNLAVAQRQGNWDCEVWPSKQMVLVSLPLSSETKPMMFAANARTGAWAPFTGWNGTCLQLYQDRMFFASTGGLIIEAETGGSDMGTMYTANCVPLFDPLKSPAALKTGMSARATLLSPTRVQANLTLQKDYTISLPLPPDDDTSPNGWGVGIWGETKWGSAPMKTTFQDWRSVAGSGYALAPGLQVSSGSLSPPDIELVQIDLTYDQGDIVT